MANSATHRFSLFRDVRPEIDDLFEAPVEALGAGGYALWVMFNPSTATDTDDDPTIRRITGFTARDAFTEFEVANLIPRRSSNPDDLIPFDRARDFPALFGCTDRDAFGVDDEQWESHHMAKNAKAVICAWGAICTKTPWATALGLQYLARALENNPVPVVCLGTSKDGHPNHPLYLKSETPLEPFNFKRYFEKWGGADKGFGEFARGSRHAKGWRQ